MNKFRKVSNERNRFTYFIFVWLTIPVQEEKYKRFSIFTRLKSLILTKYLKIYQNKNV